MHTHNNSITSTVLYFTVQQRELRFIACHSYTNGWYVNSATTDNAETTTAGEATTTVKQQTSTADSGSTTVADETTTVTDAQTQTGRTILYCLLIIGIDFLNDIGANA